MKTLADEIRRGVREEILGVEVKDLDGNYYLTAKPIMSSAAKHDRKKKFLSIEEAKWWMEQNSVDQRAYNCHRCPFTHLTTQGLKK